MKRRISELLLLMWVLVFAPQPAWAQAQRSFINTGFEANDPQGPGAPNYQIFADTAVPGWASTSNAIEMWDSNFSGVPAYEGAVFAELNANEPGALFQQVCLVNGDRFRWSFAHRARTGGPATQTVTFGVATTGGTALQTFTTQSSTTAQGWNVNSNSGGVTYTGPSGVQRVQFRTTDAGSYGNFLDGIQIFLNPFVEFGGTASSGVESIASANVPSLFVSGAVTTAFSVTVTVTGGTAVRGTDYTTPGGGATFTVSVPVGNYNQTSIPLGIAIINDTAVEGNETITFAITATPASYTIASTDTCGSAARASSTYTIVNDDSRLTLRKQWVSAVPGDDATVTVSRGAAILDTLVSDAGNAGELDTDPTPTPVVIGDILTISEALAGGNAGHYQGIVTCSGAADTNLADGLTIASGETAIICTMTNRRIGLTVTKTSSIVSDGISVTNPFAIPGAVVRYCILTTNIGATVADMVSASDTLPPQLTFVPGSMRSGTTCAGAMTVEDDNAVGADESDPFGMSIAGTNISGIAPTLAIGASFAMTFQAVVN